MNKLKIFKKNMNHAKKLAVSGNNFVACNAGPRVYLSQFQGSFQRIKSWHQVLMASILHQIIQFW